MRQEARRWEHAGAWLLGALFCAQLAGLAAHHGHMLWASLVTQGVWVCLAFGLVMLLPGPPGAPRSLERRLGMERVRLHPVSLVVLALGLLALSDGLSVILESLELRHTGALAEVHERATGPEGAAVLGALVGLALAPGIAEELLFRGALQRPLVERLGRAPGIAVAAALFGAAHLDPVHGPAAFGLGLYLGAVAELAGSTRAAIFCHVANNLAATLGARAGGSGLPLEPAVAAPLLVSVALGMLVGVWRWETRRRRADRPGPTGPPTGKAGPGLDPEGP